MNKRIFFVYLFLLFIFFISLTRSQIYIPHPLTLQLPQGGVRNSCYARVIPDRARILFLTRPDGTTDLDQYTQAYYATEYDLAPSVVVAETTAPVNLDEYQWFIGYDMTAGWIQQLTSFYQLEVVQKCDQATVLRRIP